MSPRHILSWKFGFYELFLPAIRRLGPARADAVLGALGRALAALWPPRGAEVAAALERGREALGADWDVEALRPALAANALRFLARDYPLDGASEAEVAARFDAEGLDGLRAALGEGRGAIVVGSHLGGHIAALHGLDRLGVPLRLLVQRPRHVSKALDRMFDRVGPHPQADFFLHRDLSPRSSAERLLRARAALRDGLGVYLTGDIPWAGANTRSGRLLGQARTFLAVWTDLAALTRAPVFFVFCTHLPGGRYGLRVEPFGRVSPGEEGAAVARYLGRLEAEIAAHPSDAVAHLLWPCYGPPAPRSATSPAVATRPSRRVAAVRPL